MNYSRGFRFGKNSFTNNFKNTKKSGNQNFGFKNFSKINVGMNIHQINMINAQIRMIQFYQSRLSNCTILLNNMQFNLILANDEADGGNLHPNSEDAEDDDGSISNVLLRVGPN